VERITDAVVFPLQRLSMANERVTPTKTQPRPAGLTACKGPPLKQFLCSRLFADSSQHHCPSNILHRRDNRSRLSIAAIFSKPESPEPHRTISGASLANLCEIFSLPTNLEHGTMVMTAFSLAEIVKQTSHEVAGYIEESSLSSHMRAIYLIKGLVMCRTRVVRTYVSSGMAQISAQHALHKTIEIANHDAQRHANYDLPVSGCYELQGT